MCFAAVISSKAANGRGTGAGNVYALSQSATASPFARMVFLEPTLLLGRTPTPRAGPRTGQHAFGVVRLCPVRCGCERSCPRVKRMGQDAPFFTARRHKSTRVQANGCRQTGNYPQAGLWEAQRKQPASGIKERFARVADRRHWMYKRHYPGKVP